MGVACPSAPRSSKNTGGCSRETVGVEEHNCWTYSSHGQRQPAHHNGAGNTHIIIFTPISVGGKGCQRRLHVDQSAETAVCRGVDWIGSTGVLNPIVGRGIRIFHPDHGEKQYVSVLIIQVVSSKLLPTGGNWVNNEGITSCIAASCNGLSNPTSFSSGAIRTQTAVSSFWCHPCCSKQSPVLDLSYMSIPGLPTFFVYSTIHDYLQGFLSTQLSCLTT